ncbi:GlcNAc-transferase family protein [Nitrincola sp. MINF-07-Sa-05]|uniref:GlcNAc-transferase family protein n=1 Tax=Nitrincola salilacus TaxID=3400273 RepID=UPI0039182E91
MSIFVSIASFCDENLKFTLNSLCESASGEHDIFIGVVDQNHSSISGWLEAFDKEKRVRYLHVDPFHSRGVCWARSLAGQLYDGEDYFLQIDSHTFFKQDWDKKLVDALNSLRVISPKPIISTYPPPFDFDEKGVPFTTLKPSNHIYSLLPKEDQVLTDESLVLKFHVVHIPDAEYTRGFHLAGGFIFTLGSFVEQIPYDPNLYFHGEEQCLAIRAYTHGWDIFHPRHVDIPLFHLYKKSGESYESHHWRKDLEEKRTVKWTQRRQKATERLSVLILRNGLPAPWNLGSQRSVEQFSQLSGIDYQAKEIRPTEIEKISLQEKTA